MALFIVATPIGNLNDASKRALDVLQSVDAVIVEKWSDSIKLLNYFKIKPKQIISYDERNKKKITPRILKLLETSDVALITSAGTPSVSDPGSDLVRKCHEIGIRVVPVPGPSALATAVSASGFRGNFLFIGYLPKKTSRILKCLREAEENAHNLVFFESTHRIKKTLELLSEHYPDTLIFVGKEMTKKFERCGIGEPRNFLNAIDKDKKFVAGEFTLILNFQNLKK